MIIAAEPEQRVLAVMAAQPVLAFIADAEMLDRIAEFEHLDIVRQLVVRGRHEHRVAALVGEFDYHISGILDLVEVHALAADHGVGAALAVEPVVAVMPVQHVVLAIAGDGVVELVAVAGVLEVAREDQVFNVRRERELAVPALHRVEAFIGVLDDRVARIGDVPIGALAAVERVVAATTVKEVRAVHPVELIVPVRAVEVIGVLVAEAGKTLLAVQVQHLDVLVEMNAADVGPDGVLGPSVGGLDDRVGGAVDLVGVVVLAADQHVELAVAVDAVFAVAAFQGRVAGGAHQRVVELVADPVHPGGPVIDEALDVGAERVLVQRGADRVVAGILALGHGIARADVVHVVAVAALHRVRSGIAVEFIRAGGAVHRVRAVQYARDTVLRRRIEEGVDRIGEAGDALVNRRAVGAGTLQRRDDAAEQLTVEDDEGAVRFGERAVVVRDLHERGVVAVGEPHRVDPVHRHRVGDIEMRVGGHCRFSHVACRIGAAFMGVVIGGGAHVARGRARTIVWRCANAFARNDTARDTDNTEQAMGCG